jgi:hypothetical protein
MPGFPTVATVFANQRLWPAGKVGRRPRQSRYPLVRRWTLQEHERLLAMAAAGRRPDEIARALMTVSPPGHERYFEELSETVARSGADPTTIADLRARYDTDQLSALNKAASKHCLSAVFSQITLPGRKSPPTTSSINARSL